MKKSAAVVLSAGVLLGMSGAAVPAAAVTVPDRSQVQQPVMPAPEITADGVRFIWEGGSPPVIDRYAVDYARFVNGVMDRSGWF